MPQIETERLLLRPFTLDDVDAYHAAIRSDPDVMRYLPGGVPQPRADTERVIQHFIIMWETQPFGGFAVIHKADGALIGQCGLAYVPGWGTELVELFYALAQPYWGQGFATEAARAVLRFGFETGGLERIVAVFMPENTGSERVMRKLGMASQGMLQAYGDELPCYAITRAAFAYGDGAYACTGM